jgi:uncharacterized damage-inducible protein DinB
MIEQIKWIERKFNYDFPVGMAPVILERLRGLVPHIKAVSSGLTREQLTRKIDGKWSIQEQIGHLFDLDELCDRRIDDFLTGKAELRPADITNAHVSAAGFNDRALDDLVSELQRRRSAFVRRAEALKDSDWERVSLHPRLKISMRMVDMFCFVAEHDDHHLGMIRQIINQLG